MATGDKRQIINILWDTWCIASVIGIWPRYIEPRLLSTTRLDLGNSTSGKPPIKIAQISDLHLEPRLSQGLLDKIIRSIDAYQPDIIAITGDFLCRSTLLEPVRLGNFLSKLSAPGGVFAITGNHDYTHYVAINSDGAYDIDHNAPSGIIGGFKRLFSRLRPSGEISPKLANLSVHPDLQQLLEKHHIRLLHNKTVQVSIDNQQLNISGLGEYMAGQFNPTIAFSNYQSDLPGLILSHNPDTISRLVEHPGNIILCGHSHGGAVYLPGIWNRITVLEDMDLVRGLHQRGNKTAYINRGIGGTIPFRWCSPPELTLINWTLPEATS